MLDTEIDPARLSGADIVADGEGVSLISALGDGDPDAEAVASATVADGERDSLVEYERLGDSVMDGVEQEDALAASADGVAGSTLADAEVVDIAVETALVTADAVAEIIADSDTDTVADGEITDDADRKLVRDSFGDALLEASEVAVGDSEANDEFDGSAVADSDAVTLVVAYIVADAEVVVVRDALIDRVSEVVLVGYRLDTAVALTVVFTVIVGTEVLEAVTVDDTEWLEDTEADTELVGVKVKHAVTVLDLRGENDAVNEAARETLTVTVELADHERRAERLNVSDTVPVIETEGFAERELEAQWLEEAEDDVEWDAELDCEGEIVALPEELALAVRDADRVFMAEVVLVVKADGDPELVREGDFEEEEDADIVVETDVHRDAWAEDDQREVLDGDRVPDIDAVADAELVLEPLCVPELHVVGEDDLEKVAEAVLQPECDAVDDDVPDTDDEREGVTVCVLHDVADAVCDGDDLLDWVLFRDGFIAVRVGADDAEGRTDVE